MSPCRPSAGTAATRRRTHDAVEMRSRGRTELQPPRPHAARGTSHRPRRDGGCPRRLRGGPTGAARRRRARDERATHLRWRASRRDRAGIVGARCRPGRRAGAPGEVREGGDRRDRGHRPNERAVLRFDEPAHAMSRRSCCSESRPGRSARGHRGISAYLSRRWRGGRRPDPILEGGCCPRDRHAYANAVNPPRGRVRHERGLVVGPGETRPGAAPASSGAPHRCRPPKRRPSPPELETMTLTTTIPSRR
jgi:hypothetical protein